MNKYYIDGVLVVEGKSDVSYISSFIDALFFITNGYDINEQKLEFLNRVSTVKKIIVLTDNDEAGESIAKKIKLKINDVFVVKCHKIQRKNYKKSGIAETTKDEILSSLSDFISKDSSSFIKEDYRLASLISCSQIPDSVRSSIISHYRLINGNNRYLELQLNMLGISSEELWRKYGN